MVTLSELARSVADLTGCTPDEADNFLRELFSLAASRLEEEGEVEIPCLGRFALVDGSVAYQPDSEIAAHLNSPFSDFEPMELPDGMAFEDDEAETVAPNEPEPVIEEPEEEITAVTESDVAMPAAVAEPSVPQAPAAEPEVESEAEEETPALPAERHSKKPTGSGGWIAACLICFALGGLLGYMGGRYGGFSPEPVIVSAEPVESVEEQPSEPVVAEDTAAVVPVKEEPTPPVAPEKPAVFDTITASRYLTTMARAHYGQMEYWVYIYEANSSRLGHPDRLEAGTVVRIPPADSLGLKPGDPAKISEASRKAAEIYGRFN